MTNPPHTTGATLVTIIAASELWERLKADLGQLGARGYTLMEASGYGEHGVREDTMLVTGNVRVELLVSPEVARAIFAHLARTYLGRELTAFEHDVHTLVRA
jgi:nitrogen regulatory protein PII